MTILLFDVLSIRIPFPVAAAFDEVRPVLFWFGLAILIFGAFLMVVHKWTYDRLEQSSTDSRTRLFEQRKFRRRTLVNSLIAAMGVIMASLNWAIEPMVFTILVLLILILIIAILGLVSLDMLSIGLRGLAESDDQARQAMIDEYLRQREKKSIEDSETEDLDETEP